MNHHRIDKPYSNQLGCTLIMFSIRAICISLLVTSASIALAQEQATQSPSEDLELGRRYLQCTGFWGISAPMLKALGQQVDPGKQKKLRDINELAAFTLMGEEVAKIENDVQKMKFVNDVKSQGAVKALDNWSASCSNLVETTFPSIQQRILAYAKAKRDSPASSSSEAASR